MYYLNKKKWGIKNEKFLRTKFICIIWTKDLDLLPSDSSWGLSLFVLFELAWWCLEIFHSSWGLSLFVLFELEKKDLIAEQVLED